MVTKTIRTEYMKKFKDPRWETFSKCYEDALKYRLTRRVMEHSHRPWFWEGWDSGSDSSGRSTPRLTRNKVSPLSLPPPPPPPASSGLKTSPGPEPAHQEAGAGGAGDAAPNTENGVNEAGGGSVKPVPNASSPSEDTATDDGPADTASSDGEPVKPAPKRRHRRRAPHAEPGRQDGSSDDKQAAVRKAARAKSQPPISSKENRRASSRLDGSEGRTQLRTTTNDSQTRRESDKRSNNVERRRARSADLDKVRRSQLAVVDDRWMTEYMSCFSARRR